jgi:hypothetical protein
VDLTTLTGGASIGKDASGDFMLSFAGIAVKTRGGGYVANNGRQMIDVTDLVIDGSEDYVYRVPTTEVDRGDLIITSDAPFATLFVQDVQDGGGILGVDPRTNRVQTYVQPTNIFNFEFFVKVAGVSDLLSRREDDELSAILTWMLLSGGGGGGGGQGLSPDNPLASVLLLQALSHNHDRDDILPLLIAMSSTQDASGSSNLLPLLLLVSGFRRPAFVHEIEERGNGEAREEWDRIADLRSELAEERGRRLQAKEDYDALLERIGEGQAGTPSAVSQPEARPARRTRSQTARGT